MAKLPAPTKHPEYALINMPDGRIVHIPIDQDEPIDLDEAKLFEDTARHNGHTNILDLLHDLKHQGLSRTQAVDVVCTYLDVLQQEGQR